MVMKKFVYPYRAGSRSATALAKAVEGKLIKLEGSRFQPSANKVIINWGASSLPEQYLRGVGKIINPPDKVVRASNKLKFFTLCKEAGEDSPMIPDFTTSKEEAKGWLKEKGVSMLFARTVLNGHSGEGIVKVTTEAELDEIKEGTLIVKYVKKKREFRVHLTQKGAFIVQEKLKRADKDIGEVDFHIRNHNNGFIFARNHGAPTPPAVLDQAQKAIKVSELDFGAVDVIYNSALDQAYVLEINSAPGLEGETINNYQDIIEEIING